MKKICIFIYLISITMFPKASIAINTSLRIVSINNNYYQGVPVTTGIPFPEGIVFNRKNLIIYNADSNEIPIQTDILSKWPDGSVKWMLTDLQTSTEDEYMLSCGADVVSLSEFPNKVIISEESECFKIDTGTAIIHLNKSGYGLFSNVYIDKNNDNFVSETKSDLIVSNRNSRIAVKSNNQEFTSNNGNPLFEIEENGPLRAVIKIAGSHQKSSSNRMLNYIIRIHAYAGKSYFKVHYSYRDEDLKNVEDKLNIQSIDIDISALLSSGIHNLTIAGDNEKYSSSIDDGQTASITQTGGNYLSGNVNQNANSIVYSLEGIFNGSGNHAAGWCDVSDSNAGITVAIKNFWERYPKGFSILRDGDEELITIKIWPESYNNLEFYAGEQVTTELLINFHKGDFDKEEQENIESLLDNMFIVATPSWYVETKVFGNLPTRDIENYPINNKEAVLAYYDEIDKRTTDIINYRHAGGAFGGGHTYGDINFGDARHGAWSNMHWDAPHGQFLEFLMSNNLTQLNLFLEEVWHYRDIDVLHSDCIHGNGDSYDFTGKPRYNPNNYLHNLGSEHVYNTEALIGWSLSDHYLFTGDKLSLEILKETWNYTNNVIKDLHENGWLLPYDGARMISKPLDNALSYFVATGTEEAKNSADYWFNEAIKWQDLTDSKIDKLGRGWVRLPQGTGIASSFECGHMIQTLITYGNLRNTNVDSRVLKASKWMISEEAELWKNSYWSAWNDNNYGFTVPMPNDYSTNGAMGIAYALSGDPRFINIAKLVLINGKYNSDTSSLKTLGFEMNSTPYLLYYLQKENYRPKITSIIIR